VFYTFLMALDCCVPIFAVSFLASYAVLQTVGHLRQKQDESVELNSLSSTHLSLFGAVSFVCCLNLCQVVWSRTVLSDERAVPLWVFCTFHTVVSGVAAFALLISLLYRLSLSPQQQRQLLTSAVASLNQFSLILLGLVAALWLVTTGLSAPLTLIVFFIHPGDVGGLAVVAWVNVLVISGVTLWAFVEGLRRLDRVREWLYEGYNKIMGEGMATGIYANTPPRM
jgi:hypothetical protein